LNCGPRFGVTVDKFEGEQERPRLTSFQVTVHLKNIPLKLWSRATATRILEGFGEPVFLDDVSFDGPDRRAVYTMVDCHDDRMILKSVMVHAGNFWEQVFIRVVDWAPIDPSPPSKMDFQDGRNRQGKFDTEKRARKSLARGVDRV
jgi:hypothetical protein